MERITETEILDALRRVKDPELGRDVVDLGMVRDLVVNGESVAFTLALTIPECPLADQIVADARAAVIALPGVADVNITTGAMSADERQAVFASGGPPPLASAQNKVEHVVAVMSGKGGVGKSLVTGLLAAALQRAGHAVGVLDADVTGPSIPKLFGIHGPLSGGPSGIEPARSRTGIKIMSINLLLEDEGEAVIWRGPLVSGAIKQFWEEVHWGTLDFLLVDLPPGTSDASLTVMQSLPLSGVLLVTTPQSLAAMIVRKTVRMAQVVNAPVIGVVENMAGFVAPDTGKRYDIFGPSHAWEVATLAGTQVLARLPIDPDIAAQCDAGRVEEVIRPELEATVDLLTSRLVPVPSQPSLRLG